VKSDLNCKREVQTCLHHNYVIDATGTSAA